VTSTAAFAMRSLSVEIRQVQSCMSVDTAKIFCCNKITCT
jgi:hypothetical protein